MKTPQQRHVERKAQVSFTPGPWEVVESGGKINGKNSRPICYLASRALDIRKETEANARLIAAAPELLEALKEMYMIHYSADLEKPFAGQSGLAKKVFKLIAKAEARHD